MKKQDGSVSEPCSANSSRRDALIMIAAVAAVCPPASLVTPNAAASAQTAILAIFRNRVAAGKLGHAVLATLPAAGRAALLAAILDDLALGDGDVAGGMDEIRTRLSQRIRADFAAGRTRVVDGWVLSVTETSLYALAALAPA